MAATRTRGSDSPPDVSAGRRRWRQLAEVFVLRRPDPRGDLEGSPQQIQTRDVGGPPFVGRLPVAVYCSNAHLAATSPNSPASPQGEAFRWANRKLKQAPSRYCD